MSLQIYDRVSIFMKLRQLACSGQIPRLHVDELRVSIANPEAPDLLRPLSWAQCLRLADGECLESVFLRRQPPRKTLSKPPDHWRIRRRQYLRSAHRTEICT